jgi:aminopeptidase N
MGAMENPGVVTFNDTYLYREDVPTEDMLVLANTIAH